jgi:hypothetical protein
MLTKYFIQFAVTKSGIESAVKELGTSISMDFLLESLHPWRPDKKREGVAMLMLPNTYPLLIDQDQAVYSVHNPCGFFCQHLRSQEFQT